MKKYLLALALVVLYLQGYPSGWSDDILVNEDTTDLLSKPDITVDSMCNVWISWDDASLTEGEIYYSKRDSLGNCLIPETNVSNNLSKSLCARVECDKSNSAHFVWRDESNPGYGLWHAKVSQDGTFLVPSHLVVDGAGGSFSSLIPGIALDKYQNINVIWDEMPAGLNQMIYSKLDSMGNPIIARVQVSPLNTDAYWPGIGTDSFANSHMAYRCDTTGNPYRLCYTKTDSIGNISIPCQQLHYGGSPRFETDNNQNIHMVYNYNTGSNLEIMYIKLNQDGNILIGPKNISNTFTQQNHSVDIAIDTLQYLHVVWGGDYIPLNIFVVVYAKLDTLGNCVDGPYNIVYPPATESAGIPHIAIDRNNHIHVTWGDGRYRLSAIFYKRGENEQNVDEEYKQQIRLNNHYSSTIMKGPLIFPEYEGWKLLDITGREIRTLNPAPGIYFIEVDGIITQKVIKVK